jgi:hypothetical protein
MNNFTNQKYCNFKPNQGDFRNLTCEKWTVSERKVISQNESIGSHKSIKISFCFKCKGYWKIFEEYDTHHGYFRHAIKLGEKLNIWGKEYSFCRDEINGIDSSEFYKIPDGKLDNKKSEIKANEKISSEENGKSKINLKGKLKLGLLFALLSFAIIYPAYKIILKNRINKTGIETKSFLKEKKRTLGGKTLRYNYYFKLSYKLRNGNIESTEKTVNKQEYNLYNEGDSISIIYDKSFTKELVINRE